METLTVTLQQGEVLLDGLLRSGAALAHDCGGKLACATCCVVVREGAQALSQPADDELEMLERGGVGQEGARLACQATGSGQVVVHIRHSEAPSHRGMLPVTLTAEAARFLTAQLEKFPQAAGMRLCVVAAGCSASHSSKELPCALSRRGLPGAYASTIRTRGITAAAERASAHDAGREARRGAEAPVQWITTLKA